MGGLGDLEVEVVGGMEPLARLGSQVSLAGAVRQSVVGSPRAQVVVESFWVDDTLRVYQADLGHEALVDGVVDVACLDEELVGQDAVVGGVGEPAFLRDAPSLAIPVKRFLQADQPIPEHPEPEFGQSTVVVLDDPRYPDEGVVVFVEDPLVDGVLEVPGSDGVDRVEAEVAALNGEESVLPGVLGNDVGQVEPVRHLGGAPKAGAQDHAKEHHRQNLSTNPQLSKIHGTENL